jgi:hypothetical protein
MEKGPIVIIDDDKSDILFIEEALSIWKLKTRLYLLINQQMHSSILKQHQKSLFCVV